MKKISVLLVDDHNVVRQGLRAVLATEQDIEVVAEAENGREAVTLAKKFTPDIVLMDVAMPLVNGLQATRQILRNSPNTKVLVLTSYGDDECVAQLMEAGAVGYLIKQTAANELAQALREVRKGNAFFSPTIARHLRSEARAAFRSGSEKSHHKSLTAREAEVLQLVAEGLSNKQAAARLEISIKTIEKHRQQVMKKLNIHEVAGLTRYAIARRMVSANPNENSAPSPESSEQSPSPRDQAFSGNSVAA